MLNIQTLKESVDIINSRSFSIQINAYNFYHLLKDGKKKQRKKYSIDFTIRRDQRIHLLTH